MYSVYTENDGKWIDVKVKRGDAKTASLVLNIVEGDNPTNVLGSVTLPLARVQRFVDTLNAAVDDALQGLPDL